MMDFQNIVILATVDTECDKGPLWQIRHPLQFESVKIGIPQVLMPLLRQFGITPTFLLSPEVIKDDEAAKTLAQIPDCELGTHLHGEFIQPNDNPSASRTDTPQIAYNPSIEREKLKNLTTLFESRFGYRPKSFRAGRFGLSRSTLYFLQELGYWVDSSVTPFRSHKFGNGVISDYWGAPLEPYYPSEKDPRCHGRLQVLEVPVTVVIPRLVRWPAVIVRMVGYIPKVRKLIIKRFGPPQWLRPFRGTPEELIRIAESIIRNWQGKSPPILNIMFHSVEVIPNASPYAATQEDVQYLLGSLSQLFCHLRKRYEVISLTLAEVAQWAKAGWAHNQLQSVMGTFGRN